MILIRPAIPADTAALHSLILELAAYEKLEHEVQATEEDTRAALFGPQPMAEALVAEDADGSLAGFALFYPCYSTFAGRGCLYLEDLYVRESHRRQGVGRALISAFLDTARARGCPKAEWRVLDWNESAIRFYRSLGATILEDWRPVCLGLSLAAADEGTAPPAP